MSDHGAAKSDIDTRACTCHPDDRPSYCPRKFALTHCQAAHSADGLNEIASNLRYWTSWNKADRDKEGLSTEASTAIIVVPPHWPTHGQIEKWIGAIEMAKSILREKF